LSIPLVRRNGRIENRTLYIHLAPFEGRQGPFNQLTNKNTWGDNERRIHAKERERERDREREREVIREGVVKGGIGTS